MHDETPSPEPETPTTPTSEPSQDPADLSPEVPASDASGEESQASPEQFNPRESSSKKTDGDQGRESSSGNSAATKWSFEALRKFIKALPKDPQAVLLYAVGVLIFVTVVITLVGSVAGSVVPTLSVFGSGYGVVFFGAIAEGLFGTLIVLLALTVVSEVGRIAKKYKENQAGADTGGDTKTSNEGTDKGKATAGTQTSANDGDSAKAQNPDDKGAVGDGGDSPGQQDTADKGATANQTQDLASTDGQNGNQNPKDKDPPDSEKLRFNRNTQAVTFLALSLPADILVAIYQLPPEARLDVYNVPTSSIDKPIAELAPEALEDHGQGHHSVAVDFSQVVVLEDRSTSLLFDLEPSGWDVSPTGVVAHPAVALKKPVASEQEDQAPTDSTALSWPQPLKTLWKRLVTWPGKDENLTAPRSVRLVGLEAYKDGPVLVVLTAASANGKEQRMLLELRHDGGGGGADGAGDVGPDAPPSPPIQPTPPQAHVSTGSECESNDPAVMPSADFAAMVHYDTVTLTNRSFARVGAIRSLRWYWDGLPANWQDECATRNSLETFHPIHQFDDIGVHSIGLVVKDDSGCCASKAQNVTIAEVPKIRYDEEPPPDPPIQVIEATDFHQFLETRVVTHHTVHQRREPEKDYTLSVEAVFTPADWVRKDRQAIPPKLVEEWPDTIPADKLKPIEEDAAKNNNNGRLSFRCPEDGLAEMGQTGGGSAVTIDWSQCGPTSGLTKSLFDSLQPELQALSFRRGCKHPDKNGSCSDAEAEYLPFNYQITVTYQWVDNPQAAPQPQPSTGGGR